MSTNLFIGFGAIALILAAIVWRRHATVPGLTRTMLIALALLFAATLSIGYLSFYHLILWLPGVKAIRAVSRIILMMLIPMSILVALGADAVWQRLGRGIRGLPVLVCLAALVVSEPLSLNLASVPIAEWRNRLDTVKSRLPPSIPKDAILFVRTASPNEYEQYWTELDAMVLGQDLGYPVLNGVSAFYPPGYRFRRCVPARERLEGYANFTGTIDVSAYFLRLVVVDRSPCPPA